MKYAKAIAAAVGSIVTVFAGVAADNVLSSDEWASLASAVVAAALTVYAVVKVENKSD